MLSMLGKAPPTTSNLDLVKAEVLDSAETPDAADGKIKMADLVESLDTRELDIDEGEDIDYDGSILGENLLFIPGRRQYNYKLNSEAQRVNKPPV